MGKIIFLFKNIKIVTDTMEDLELTEDFLTDKDVVDKLEYNPEELAEAYKAAEKDYKIV